jgi:hypothetical protein
MDKDKLRELLADANATTESIYSGLGYNNEAALYYHLKKDPEAKALFSEWRALHRRSGSGKGASKRPPAGKRAKAVAPPRNGHANGISNELLRKLKHEFEHISLYDSKTEFFDEIVEELKALA